MAVAITATQQDSWPPRVLVSVTGLTVGDAIELYREVGGERTAVRAGSDDSVADVSFLRTDAELPFGVPVTYVAVVNGTDEYSTAATTYTLPGGKVAVTDAINGNAAETVIMAWDEKGYNRQSSVFKVGGRNVVVSGDLGMFEGDIELYTETTSSRDNLFATLEDATEGVIQIRQPGGYDGVDSYLAVLGMRERRWSQDGSDQRRIFTLNVAEVEGWAPQLEAMGTTLQAIGDAYASVPITTAGIGINNTFASTTDSWTADSPLSAPTRVATPSQVGDGSLETHDAGGTTNTAYFARSAKIGTSTLKTRRHQVLVQFQSGYAGSVTLAVNWQDASATTVKTTVGSPISNLAAGTWYLLEVDSDREGNSSYQFEIRISGVDLAAGNPLYVDYAKSLDLDGPLVALSNDYSSLLAIAQGEFA